MNSVQLAIVLLILTLTACGHHESPPPLTFAKIEGANVKTLTHEQLLAVLHECHQYGSSDDPRVKYSIAYCSAAQSRHSMEGYSSRSSAIVDPALNPMH